MRAHLNNTRKPVLDILVTVSEAWSALTLSLITKLNPLDCGILGGSTTLPSMYLISLYTQSIFWYLDSLLTGSHGSNTI